ncbi:MAG: 16S rRNA (cytosine(1402)-N(4))-methyltransferase RsmH [Desulfosudaceae bacterium]
MQYRHTPVMPYETVRYLNCEKGMAVADCTVGGGGHAALIAEKILPGGLLIGIDRDADALQQAARALQQYEPGIRLVHDNFANFPDILHRLNLETVDGALVDLGLSLYQIEGSGRGFSFSRAEPLDMRMDVRQTTTAADIVNGESQADLCRLFQEYGEERYAARIAGRVVAARQEAPIETSDRLAEIVRLAYPAKARHGQKIHPATRVFMALRIAVNTELENLKRFLAGVADCLTSGARLCVLSFHSLEDRIVKHQLRWLERECVCPPGLPVCQCDKQPLFRVITRKPLRPGEAEIAANPMARSTRLRVAEKI